MLSKVSIEQNEVINIFHEYTKLSDLQLKNPKVSEFSKFEDDVWRFSSTKNIYWKKIPVRFKVKNLSAYYDFIPTVKTLGYLLITDKQLKPGTLYYSIRAVNEFSAWLLMQKIPVQKFRDVTVQQLEEYVFCLKNLKSLRRNKTKLSSNSVHIKKHAISRLYYYREILEDGLLNLPVDFLYISPVEKGPDFIPAGSKTKVIEEKVLQKIYINAFNYINENSTQVFSELKAFIKSETPFSTNSSCIKVTEKLAAFEKENFEQALLKSLRKQHDEYTKNLSRGSYIRYLARKINISFELCSFLILGNPILKKEFLLKRRFSIIGSKWDTSELNRKLRLLQISCFIVIAVSTGMRLSELLAIEPNSIIKKKIKGTNEKFYWIKSRLFKTTQSLNGEIAYWLCGEHSVVAIKALEPFNKLIPSHLQSLNNNLPIQESLFRSYIWDGEYLKARSSPGVSIYKNLKLFLDHFKLEIKHVHPHQFRRTFAVNAIKYAGLSIEALKRHFKHISILMTDYYLGADHDLVRLYFEETKKNSNDLLKQILMGECAGPGGIITNKRLKRMVENDQLSINYLGKTGIGNIENLIEEFSDYGLMAYKCGEFTTCLYVPSSAKCGEGGPKEHECHPTQCANSFILLEDVPFYLNNIRQNDAAMKKNFIKENEDSPLLLFYKRRIINDVKAVKPLIDKYQKKINETQEMYNNLDNEEKNREDWKLSCQKIKIDLETINKFF